MEINVQIVQAIKIDKLDFHRVCLQSEDAPISGGILSYVYIRNIHVIFSLK
ncbi:hypothetical protein RCO48_30070 [Peribacillus frigoritolerans]|nr:hypothetical protein [Peribacillus frigoritolerans]